MGNPAAGISAVITIYDGVEATDGGATDRRARILRCMQITNDFVHNLREWDWTYTSTALAISSANDDFIALPTNFNNIGDAGMLWDTGRNIPMTKVSKYQLMRLRLVSRGSSIRPVFSIFDNKLQFPGVAPAAATLFHRIQPETLADDSTEMLIPDRWFKSVIIPGTAAGGQELKSDARDIWRGQFRDGLIQMCQVENPARQGIKVPMALPGAW